MNWWQLLLVFLGGLVAYVALIWGAFMFTAWWLDRPRWWEK